MRAFARVFRRKSEERREDVRKKRVVVSLDHGHHHQSARNQRLAANNRRKRRGDEEISVERSPTGSYSGHERLCKRRGTNSRGGKSRRAVAMDIFLVFLRVFFLRSGLECARGYSRDVVTFHLKGGEIREI